MSPKLEDVPSSAAMPTEREMVRVEHVSKRFSLRHNHRLKELVFSALQRKKLADTFMALDDVDLTVHAGETVGLIGFNGSGKSTTIKMLTGIVEVGLFCHMAKSAYFGNQDGSVTIKWHDGRVEQVAVAEA